MLFFQNRQNATGQTEEQLEIIFKSLADSFSYKWLKTAGSNPLQQLWRRGDSQATNELYAFGDAVLRLKDIDPKWLAEQIKHIKSDHVNNRNGAFFEINAVAMLATSEQEVKPAKGNNPGYDVILKLSPKKSMRVSLKNYADSSHYKNFHAAAQRFEDHLKEVLKKLHIVAVQVIIEKMGDYPEKTDWQQLTDSLESMLLEHRDKGVPMFAIGKKWAVIFAPLQDQNQPMYPDSNSYILVLAAPYHKNEHKNLLDKLDEAAANLLKHSKGEDHEICNIVFIHIAEAASALDCKVWAEEYLANHPEKPLTGIILYQPVIATDIEKDTSFIHHGFQIVFNTQKFEKWNTDGINLNFSLPIGVLNSEPSVNAVIIEKDHEKEKITFENKYFFQRGNLYLNAVKDAEGNINGNIQKFSSGVFSHSVFQPFPDQPAMVISGRFAPVDKLLIL